MYFCVLCIVCVCMCPEQLPPGGYPIAVKYIVSYQIEERLNSGIALYYSIQNRLSSALRYRNIMSKIIFSVVLYGCQTWSLTLKEEHTLRVVENRVLKTLHGSNRKDMTCHG
jgi:hypothetical protein